MIERKEKRPKGYWKGWESRRKGKKRRGIRRAIRTLEKVQLLRRADLEHTVDMQSSG